MIQVNFQNAFVGTQAKRILDIAVQRIRSCVLVKRVQSGEEKCVVKSVFYKRIVCVYHQEKILFLTYCA